MSPIVRELLVKGLMAGTAIRSAKKTSQELAYYALAGIVSVIGFVFLAMASYTALLAMVTAPIAAAIVGAVCFALSGVIALWGHHVVKSKGAIRKPAMDGSFIDSIESGIKSVIEGFEDPVRDNPKMALLMAALAGFAAGDQLGERNIH